MATVVRKSFEEQLQELQDDLLRMGRFVEGAVAKAMRALINQDVNLANEVIQEDDIADDLDVEIFTKAMKLLALQQPMARDLRIIGTALKIVTDLERIGDHAVDIAKLAKILSKHKFFKPLVDIPKLADLALGMVHNSLQAYINRDIELAIQVCRDDDMVDELYESLFEGLVGYMERDPSLVSRRLTCFLSPTFWSGLLTTPPTWLSSFSSLRLEGLNSWLGATEADQNRRLDFTAPYLTKGITWRIDGLKARGR
jgi:phosphate transport system protein